MSDILFDLHNKVLTITLNKPDKLNPIGDTMSIPAIERLKEAVTDPAVGCVVLTGAGRAFCAGGDVSNMGGAGASVPMTYEENVEHQRMRHEFPLLLHSMPKVTIAAVNGHAMGAGLGLAASCDLRLASEKGKFGTAFANVGLGGDFGTTWQLNRLLGESKAKELFFLTDIIDADEALRIGLVNRVLPAEGFMDQVCEIAERIANGPLVSYRWMKENLNQSSHVEFRTMLDKEAVSHLRCAQTEDHKEGVAAFMEKRSANFKGR
ncbi:MAG: enoyl-CoA hydratase [Proteobacteria bacterium]|jgi:2-(1,2-epoxy-1,2-dihydrophenyl)acetyl-CoA isomerase|nr:enoyl-CoA hydratase [Pseudomonadota bacterium]MDA1299376.1 enoyl-CoA hydratase [Pseudomonadota bacterium]